MEPNLTGPLFVEAKILFPHQQQINSSKFMDSLEKALFYQKALTYNIPKDALFPYPVIITRILAWNPL